MKNILNKLKSFIGQPVITKRREPSFKELLESGTDVEIHNYLISKAYLLKRMYPADDQFVERKLRQFIPYIAALTHLRVNNKLELTEDVLINNLSALKFLELSENELVPIEVRKKLTVFLQESPAYIQEHAENRDFIGKFYEHWRYRVLEISEILILIKKSEDLLILK
jgi:hypothetical protein